MTRKEFIKTSCALCGAGVIGTIAFLESCKKSKTSSVNFTLDLNASANSSLKNVGGYVYSNGVIVTCVSSGTYIALSQSCTHDGCTVTYGTSNSKFNCPCHGGVFDQSGNVVAGPPPKALKKYNVSQNGSILTISG